MKVFVALISLIAASIWVGPLSFGDDAVKETALPKMIGAALFNGKDLMGWDGVASSTTEDWKVADGVLEGHGTGGGWIIAPGEYESFRLKLEFRISDGGNSGVFLRAPRTGTPHVDGLEIQILDDSAKQYADIDNTKKCGSLMLEVGPSKRASKKPGEWQKMEVECNGSQVSVVLNGEKIVDVDLAKTESLENHPGRKRSRGHIGFQDHGERVDFRNVSIKELPKP